MTQRLLWWLVLLLLCSLIIQQVKKNRYNTVRVIFNYGYSWIRNLLDCHCCCFWDHRSDSSEVQQCDSTCAECPKKHQAKKELNNIPDDGHWIYQFNTRPPEEKFRRFIQAKKFYATLPHKIDSAIEDYKKSIPEPEEDLEWEWEKSDDGWTISYRYKNMD